jgi:hypothetical protein
MKPIRYTRHAKNRKRWHKISDEHIELCVSAPELTERCIYGRINAWKRIGDRFLKVSYIEEENEFLIISTVFKRKMPEGGAVRR